MSDEDRQGSERLTDAVQAAMPTVVAELTEMVAIPSVALPGYPAQHVLTMAERVVEAFSRVGVEAHLQPIDEGYPAVWAEVPGPTGAPTVLLYAHYDVQPAPKEGWLTDPWTVTERDGRLYGRGVADDKSGIAIHLAALAAFGGRPPVTVKIVIEGEEETASHLEAFVAAHPDRFKADAMLIADVGNLRVGEPVLVEDLRGQVKAIVEVSTLAVPVHSGLFGGAAPDALMALITTLSRLIDADGSSAVDGVDGAEWEGTDLDPDLVREQAGVLSGVDLVGAGSVAGRLWSRPSVSVLGIDAPRSDEAANVLHATASAVVAMRIPSGQDPSQAVEHLASHLERSVPWNAQVRVTGVEAAAGFAQSDDGPLVRAFSDCLADAYGRPAGVVGSGGSIPLLATLREACPDAEFVLFGAEDMEKSNIHGPNESVDIAEIQRLAVAEALFLSRIGARGAAGSAPA